MLIDIDLFMIITISGIVYAILNLIVILFQVGLAIGMPWGAASMGGKFPGKYPPKMRFVALVNILLLSFFTLVVMIESGLIISEFVIFTSYIIWVIVVFSIIGVVLNTITPSKIERIWAPLILIQLIASLIIALNK